MFLILWQITMTKEWLLLLLLLLFTSSQSVDGQPTIDDQLCHGLHWSETRRDATLRTLLNNQELMFELLSSVQQQLLTNNSRLGKFPAKGNIGKHSRKRVNLSISN